MGGKLANSTAKGNHGPHFKWGLPRKGMWSIIVFVVVMLTLGLSSSSELNQVEATSKSISTEISSGASSVCSRSPLCSKPGNPSEMLLKFCNPISSYFYRFYLRTVKPLGRVSGIGSGRATTASPKELPFFDNPAVREHALRELQELFASRLYGQLHVPAPLVEAIRNKMYHPLEPTVIHLAGDNGVGKTFTVRLVSRALSLRCGANSNDCDAGDSLLTISGTSFEGLPLEEARRDIVGRITQHMRDFPHGIVLIDDMTAMDPALVAALAPLFGRGTHFPEQLYSSYRAAEAPSWKERKAKESPTAPPVSQLLVFITTDLGKQGRTMGKSIQQIEQMVRASFSELYGSLLPAYTYTYAYLPFTARTAEDVVRGAVAQLPCELSDKGASSVIVASDIDDMAVSFLVQKLRPEWDGKENAHALKRTTNRLRAQVLAYLEKNGLDQRIIVRLVLDKRTMEVKLRVDDWKSDTADL